MGGCGTRQQSGSDEFPGRRSPATDSRAGAVAGAPATVRVSGAGVRRFGAVVRVRLTGRRAGAAVVGEQVRRRAGSGREGGQFFVAVLFNGSDGEERTAG